MRKIDKIIIHCTATPPRMDIGVDEVRRWHKQRGWSDIGYHYLIRRDGAIEEGRPIDVIGAHCKGYNANSIGIVYVGGVAEDGKTPEDNRTYPQRMSLIRLILQLKAKYPNVAIHGHNEFSYKACPSFDVQEWKQEQGL